MNLEFTLIPYGHISYVIPTLLRYFDKSQYWSAGRAGIDDIVKFVMTGQMQLWLVFNTEDTSTYGYVITEVKQYPQKKMLVVQYCAGESNHMQYVGDKIFEVLARYAADAGCTGVEFFGRPGWGPYAKKHGYAAKTVVYEKNFDEVKS